MLYLRDSCAIVTRPINQVRIGLQLLSSFSSSFLDRPSMGADVGRYECLVFLLPVRASEQGNVIGLVSVVREKPFTSK